MEQPAEAAGEDGSGVARAGPGRRSLVAGLLVLVLAGVLAFALLKPPRPICLAVATSLSGASAPAGEESLAAFQIAVADANAAGGVNGRAIRLRTFDDQSRGDVARRNVPAIAESECLGVLGHYLSTTSLAAAPGYRSARMPALTGSAFVDELTVGNPWYFRAQITASMQGRAIADYLQVFDDAPEIELISSDDSFGRDYARAFLAAYPRGRVAARSFSASPTQRKASAVRLAETIAGLDVSPIVVLGTGADHIPDVLMALRRAGVSGPVIAAGGAGSAEFLQRFAAEPEERRRPGFFTGRLYATPPLIFDSAGARAQVFAGRYRELTHRSPSWIAAGAYDAATMMIEAMRRAEVRNRAQTRAADRNQVRIALSGMRGPQTAVAGLTRPVWLDADRNMPGAVRMGVFARGRFMSHPRQLVPVENPLAVDLAQEMAAGNIVAPGNRHYWQQQVVYTGIDLNRLNRVDLKQGSFNADLNLWMRFVGNDDAATSIEFPDLLSENGFDPASPVEASVIPVPAYVGKSIGTRPSEPYNYRLYRLVGDFKADYDLHEYPFDTQELVIRFLNRDDRRELVSYVVDSQELALANSEQRLPHDLSAFRGLQQWHLHGVRYFAEALSRPSSLGKPSAIATSPTQFSGFNVAIVLQRNYGIFLVKTLIPLLLLVVVVFTTLFLPGNLFRERINIPVTAILTSSVLLLSVNNQIGDIGYTVAMEYIFYAFFALCVMAMLIGITHDALSLEGHERRATVLAQLGQVLYVCIVAVVIAVVWLRFAR